MFLWWVFHLIFSLALKELAELREKVGRENPEKSQLIAPVYILQNGTKIIAWKVDDEGKKIKLIDFNKEQHEIAKASVKNVIQ